VLDNFFIFQRIDDGRHFKDFDFSAEGSNSHEEAVQRKDDLGRELQITLFWVKLIWIR